MRKSTLSKYMALVCLLIVFGCKSKKHLVAEHKRDTVKSTGSAVASSTPVAVIGNKPVMDAFKLGKLKEIRLKQIDFTTFSGKAQAKLNIDGDKHDVTLNIRIKKDKQIWISITALLGIEAARVLITPDSIKVMNRLEATCLKKPFSYVYGYTSRQINYKTIESLLIGNAITELINDNADLKADNGGYTLTGNLHELAYQVIVGPGLKVNQTFMSDQQAGQSLQVNNSALIQSGDRVIPSQISINSAVKQKTVQADLKYTRADFEQPVDMPFAVPARYSLIN